MLWYGNRRRRASAGAVRPATAGAYIDARTWDDAAAHGEFPLPDPAAGGGSTSTGRARAGIAGGGAQ